MSDPNDPPTLPAIVAPFLLSPGGQGAGTWVRAQVTNDGGDRPSAPDALSCSLLLHAWELTICLDGSAAELFYADSSTTLSIHGDWRGALRDLRLILADPRLDLLLAMTSAAETSE